MTTDDKPLAERKRCLDIVRDMLDVGLYADAIAAEYNGDPGPARSRLQSILDDIVFHIESGTDYEEPRTSP